MSALNALLKQLNLHLQEKEDEIECMRLTAALAPFCHKIQKTILLSDFLDNVRLYSHFTEVQDAIRESLATINEELATRDKAVLKLKNEIGLNDEETSVKEDYARILSSDEI